MKKIALKIAYIGTKFHGFQRQPNHRTVEGELIYTLKKLGYIDNVHDSKFGIAGRTDKGVHSLGNVVSFMSEREIIINQINHKLPDDIQIIAKAPVRYGFKPRYAKCKHYRYMFFENDLDISAMRELTSIFQGEHDFTNFSKRNESQKDMVRTINKIDVVSSEAPVVSSDGSALSSDGSVISSEESVVSSKESVVSSNGSFTEQSETYSQKIDNSEYFKYSQNFKYFKRYNGDLKEPSDFIESNYIGELKSIGRFNENFENINFDRAGYNPIFIDIYGESFLWNMVRKMMRIFLFVGKNEIEVDVVKDMLDPANKYNIKPLNPENLILMDVEYNNIRFTYDGYAFEGFKRTLIENLFDYKLKLSIENSILNSMKSLESNIINKNRSD